MAPFAAARPVGLPALYLPSIPLGGDSNPLGAGRGGVAKLASGGEGRVKGDTVFLGEFRKGGVRLSTGAVSGIFTAGCGVPALPNALLIVTAIPIPTPFFCTLLSET